MPDPAPNTEIPVEIAVQMLQTLRQLSLDLAAVEAKAEKRHIEMKPALEVYRRQTERIEAAQAESLARAAAAQLDQAAELKEAVSEGKIAKLKAEKQQIETRREIIAAVAKLASAALGGSVVTGALLHYFGAAAAPMIQNTTFSSQVDPPQVESSPSQPAPSTPTELPSEHP